MARAPDARADRDTEEADRWRTLAVALAALLAQGRAERSAEAERHAARQAAQRAAHERDLVQDRENFLALVAHELKTPVAVIKAYAELLEAQMASESTSGAMREVVGHILEQADVMAALIEEVLDVQRLRTGKLPLELSRVDLVQLARSVGDEVQQTTRAHLIRVVSADPPPAVLADRRRLRQALANLLENAVKFSAGGEIEARAVAEERDGRAHVVLAIRDQGIGIDPADLNRIFERFEQVSGAPVRGHVGLGLGLYVARQIARAHGGEVWAESAGQGLGSTFYLALPVVAD